MSNFNEEKGAELIYIEKTLEVIKRQLTKEEENLNENISKVIASRREMWQDSVHFSEDFDRIPEMNHYLSEVNRETRSYESSVIRVKRYKKMLNSPYFGRFDFTEEDYDEREKIYIGLHNLMNEEDDTIYVYDWRAPISSIFYRSEVGEGSYMSPVGLIKGEVSLKRQYKIYKGNLKFYFDSSVRITDDILQEVLSRNSSSKMKHIVETIQKEQDMIIRDTENEVLIVQGVAGSGKTSIALHRIAYLLYEGLNSKIGVNNVIILSPNSQFSEYISNVLPELGEENVKQKTFSEISRELFGEGIKPQSKEEQLETLICNQGKEEIDLKLQSIKFKGSEAFKIILDRLLLYCERSLIKFEDIYYDGKIIEKKEELRMQFLHDKIGMPIAKRLTRMENMILNKIHPLRKDRLEKIESIVQRAGNHIFEVKGFSRLMAVKEAQKLMKDIRKFTKVDYTDIYKRLFSDKGLFGKITKDLELPSNIEAVLNNSMKALQDGYISYEDSAPLLYLKLKLEGLDSYSEIKQVVIDEAQDYYPMHYEILNLLFKRARYTVVGDFNQTIEKSGDRSIYDQMEKIFNKKKSVKLFMNKSYRSSIEINEFNQKLMSSNTEFISFDRHGEKPRVIFREDDEGIIKSIAKQIEDYLTNDYNSIAIITKTEEEAEVISERLRQYTNIDSFYSENTEDQKNIYIISSYMAKGMEFDVVIVYDVSKEKYNSDFDRRLLYVACTRALHQLILYYTGERTKFI
jgi:DNA helicase-2/ATP-dependent DNA helicase PcrA